MGQVMGLGVLGEAGDEGRQKGVRALLSLWSNEWIEK